MENIFVEFLPPWVETGLQPAFYDKESGTVLQQTARMYARVNMLIRMFNKLSKQTKQTVEDYIDQFNTLHDYVHDYFDNLDVQEEINNKLDAMVEAGTLQEIIADYLNSKAIFGFDSVASMKGATNLIEGSYALTLGYYNKNDNGCALYKIRAITNADDVDEMFIVAMTTDPTLVAELIVDNNTIVPESVGVYGDGTTDCTTKLQTLINYAAANGLKVDGNGDYKISNTITLPNYQNIYVRLRNIDCTTLSNKPAFLLDHCRYPRVEIQNITFTKGNGSDIHNSYIHETAFLLKSVSYGEINVNYIQNALCAFTLYSDGGSGTDGCYYNKLHCGKADVFNLVHYYNEDGAVNGNEINDTLHIVSEWNNPNNLPFYTIVNEAHTDGGTIYKNNHNVANNLMVEKYTDDGMDYLVADLTDASNFYIYVDRIEIKPTLAISDPVITTNSNSQYNLVKLNTGWFTIPESNSKIGNNNYVVTFNNYKKSLNNTFYIGSGATLTNDFTAIQNNICDGTISYNPAVGRVRINGIFAPTVNLSQNTNYTFCNFTFKGKTCTHGLVYLAGGGNPTNMTQIGTLRRVKDQYYCTLRISQNVSANAYLFIDFEAENDG